MREIEAGAVARWLPRPIRSSRLLFHIHRVVGANLCSWSELVAWLDTQPIDAVAFDVYDTLLSRQLNHSSTFEGVLAARLVAAGAWPGSPDAYCAARAAAKSRLAGENLRDWYRHQELSPADAERCIAEELDLERSITIAVPGAAAALDHLRASGRPISFISDMHLPGSFIGELLVQHGLRSADELLLVSGDEGVWKSDGGLYERWLSEVEIEPNAAAYVGNTPFVDHAVPAALGFRAKARTNANPNRYETTMAHGGTAGAVISSAATRSRLAVDPSGKDPAASVGASVVGQTMMAFLLAIRTRCLEDNIHQIGFVARDSDLLLQMAKLMPTDYWDGISFQYVEGNRLTWTLAGADALGLEQWVALGTADENGFLQHGLEEASTDGMLRRIGLQMSDLEDLDPELRGLVRTAPIPANRWRTFLHDTSVHKLIGERAADRADLVETYIKSLGLDQDRLMLVDIGWRGQAAAAVSGLFERVLGVAPLNYHFGGYGVHASIDAVCDIDRYAFDDGKGPAPFSSIDQCLEMFTGMGQPRAVDYTKVDGSVVPVHDDGLDVLAVPERKRIWEAARHLASAMPPAATFDRWCQTAPDAVAVTETLRHFWTTPSRPEGELGARLLLEVDDGGSVIVPMSSPYQLRATGQRRWRQGSLAISNPIMRAALPALWRLRSD